MRCGRSAAIPTCRLSTRDIAVDGYRVDGWNVVLRGYIPFSAGPRTCTGDHFAVFEATLALATIVRRVEIRSLGDDFPFALTFTWVAASPNRAEVTARRTR